LCGGTKVLLLVVVLCWPAGWRCAAAGSSHWGLLAAAAAAVEAGLGEAAAAAGLAQAAGGALWAAAGFLAAACCAHRSLMRWISRPGSLLAAAATSVRSWHAAARWPQLEQSMHCAVRGHWCCRWPNSLHWHCGVVHLPPGPGSWHRPQVLQASAHLQRGRQTQVTDWNAEAVLMWAVSKLRC
jgi:hypothetical protein